MLCCRGFELFSRWVPLTVDENNKSHREILVALHEAVSGFQNGGHPRCNLAFARALISSFFSEENELSRCKSHCTGKDYPSWRTCSCLWKGLKI